MNSLKALTTLLRRVWDVYLDDNDMTRDQCPIKGVFAGAVEEPAVDVEVGEVVA